MTISEKIKIVIVTGLSGAGKTQAMKALEDLDFFCIDNLPPSLLPQLIAIHQSTEETRPVAVAMDVRGKGHFAQLTSVITWLEESLVSYKVVFLECENDILVRRFSETRRRHPLADQGSIYDSIAHERKLLADVRQLAHLIIDTSAIKPAELKALLNSALLGSDGTDVLMQIDLLSFGFKYGVPNDADIIFDVRFLPNPFYIDELKQLTGEDPEVADYVLDWPQTQAFIDKFYDLIVELLPAYSKEGKARLTIGIGCTGGQHRSVAISRELGRRLTLDGFHNQVRHRDLPEK
ncbi:MAG TPA: RNase adapter RapZ [Firmicutes bacterium]|jgi:UPF0042 nucleotide-binding protein|nr:RNase adapter RapZ [Bacillota bacterium]